MLKKHICPTSCSAAEIAVAKTAAAEVAASTVR
jgi:hypothetical protein